MSLNTDYRMIAIDLDGTLLDPAGQVTPRVRRAVHALIDKGWVVCFATGRTLLESRPVLEQVGHFDQAVFVGGAVVMDTRAGITLHQQKMEPQLARALSQLLEEMGHAVLALQDSSAAGADYFATAGVPLDEATQRWMAAFGIRLTPLPSLADHNHAHTIRLGVVGTAGETRAAEQRIRETFAERVLCHSLRVLGDVEVLECFDPAVNKWEGIRQVARHHGIDESQVVAVGDDWNDLAMIRHAGLGVAMGNARPQIKAIAQRVIGPNHEEGLAVFLEELAGQQPASASRRNADEVAA